MSVWHPTMECPVFGRANPTLGTICSGHVATAGMGAGRDHSHMAGLAPRYTPSSPLGDHKLSV